MRAYSEDADNSLQGIRAAAARHCLRQAAQAVIASAIEQHNHVALVAKAHGQYVRRVFEHAEDSEDWRGIDGFAERVVVKADVAAGDGNGERAAGFGDAVDGAR